MSQIEARAGTIGALYATKSGHRVRILRFEADQVILVAPGQEKEIPVPSYYVLIPTAEEAAPEQVTAAPPAAATHTVEQLAGLQPAAEARRLLELNIPLLSTPDLERLSELDTRMFAMDMVARELQRRAAVNIPAEMMTGGENHSNARAQTAVVLPVAAAPSEAPPKPRRAWIMLLRDEMLIEVPGRRALRIAYEGDGAPRDWWGFRAATPPEGYDGPETGDEPAADVGVRMLTGALKAALGDDAVVDPAIEGWELQSTMRQAIEEARLAVHEAGTPRGLTTSRDQAALIKDMASLTGLAWMVRGAVQPTTQREIERQVKVLEAVEGCETVAALEALADNKRLKPLERPGVARLYKSRRQLLEAIEEAVPPLAWCAENGFTFDLSPEEPEQEPSLWLEGLGEETPERIRAAGAAARAVKDRQLADREEREAPPAPPLAPLTERIARFVGGTHLIPEWITRETFSDRCFERIAVLVGDPDSDALPLLDRTTDLKILETAAAWLTASEMWPERLELIREQILDVKGTSAPPTPAPVNLAGAPLSEQLATCSAARALELLAGATERDRREVWRGWGLAPSARVKTACQEWMDQHQPPVDRETARLAELQARASVALGQFSSWPIEVSHQMIRDDDGSLAPDWCVMATTPNGHRRAGHGTTLEGAAGELRLMLEREFPSPTPPTPSEPAQEEIAAPPSEPAAQAARKRDAPPPRQAAAVREIGDAQALQAAIASSALKAAQAALSALAIGLPAMAQLGLDVDIRITTRRPSADKS